MNPRAATNDLLPFQGSPFNHLGTSAWLNLDSIFILTGSQKTCQRRGWDSNPRALADKRFSRPPRYDHFDTSPCAVSCFALTNQLVHNTKYWKICQGLFSTFFIFFSAFSKKRCFFRNYKVFAAVRDDFPLFKAGCRVPLQPGAPLPHTDLPA